ncbi:MAG: general secretion pathway protein GspK [Myxococcales bacterium]|nr:general secretion pathway protein GspK [Myxococcales bacterium]
MSERAAAMSDEKAAKGEAAKGQGQHGVAILMVVACLAILIPFTATFSLNSRVDFQSAINLRDEVVARNLQRGALRLSLLLFELQRMVFSQKQFREMVGAMDITQVAPYLMSIFGSKDGSEAIGGIAGMLGFDGFDASVLGDLSIDYGSFEVRLEAESGKVNVNCLAQGAKDKDNPQARVAETLEAMLMPTLLNPLFEEEKSDGQRYTRGDVIQAIVDYVDEDVKKFDVIKLTNGSAQERYRYTELFDPYEPRNARMDSIEEMHLVQGVDDDLMLAIGGELTVYGGDCKVNLNFASADQIALVLRNSVTEEDRWRTEGENFLLKTMPLARYVVEYRTFSLFKDTKSFVDFVAKPDQFISPLALLGSGGSGSGSSPMRNPNMPRIPEGMALREKSEEAKNGDTLGGVADIATVAPERVYRVEIITEVGSVRRRLNAIYDMQYARSQSKGKGAWLYYRED